MTFPLPTPCAFGCLQYYPTTNSLVLVDTGNFPVYLQPTVNTWTFTNPNWVASVVGIPNNPSGRTNCGMAFDGTNLVLFGGIGPDGTGYLNDTWAFNGSAWSNPITNDGYDNGLVSRKNPYMAAMTGGVVLFGGQEAYYTMQDTWFWNKSEWVQQFPTNSPPIRVGAYFASNGTNNAILFGGANESFMLNDTWSWNGSNWTQLITNTPPSVRQNGVMAWYPPGSCFILFGGSDTSGNLLNQTWMFNGVSTWTQLFPTNSPSTRVGAMMAYDSSTSQMILFGGKNSAKLFNDTWQFTPATWIKISG
jgi:hypothetical protein